MKKICFLVITGLCMASVTFGQEKAPKKPSPPPPPPEIVKDIKIENVKEVEPPPPPPPPPLPPKKGKHHVHTKINSGNVSNDNSRESMALDADVAEGKISKPASPTVQKDVIMATEADTAKRLQKPHVVHHKVKKVIVQPKDPGKTTKSKSLQQVSN